LVKGEKPSHYENVTDPMVTIVPMQLLFL